MYFDYPLYCDKCLECPFLSWAMVDADEYAPYCSKWNRYADDKIEQCNKIQ